jgi:hypothetical protein
MVRWCLQHELRLDGVVARSGLRSGGVVSAPFGQCAISAGTAI